MASGFSGGGPGSEFFAGIGNRSLAGAAVNNPRNPNFRSRVSGVFLDPNSQIAHGFAGKRTLLEFQSQYLPMNQNQNQNQSQNQFVYQNQVVNGLNLRSVKQRLYNHASPISPLSPIEYSGVNFSPEGFSLASAASLLQQRCGNFQSTGGAISGINTVQKQAMAQESEERMMNRLQELEKQLLDDDDGGDAVSVVTNTNSEWSETIQSLVEPNQNPFSPSPTSSSTSTSSSAVTATSAADSPRRSLIAAATAISEGQNDAASGILTRLGQSANPRPDSEQRLTGLVVSALKSRLGGAEATPPAAELYGREHVAATHLLYDMSPCFKLGFMAANQAILEAMIGDRSAVEKIHVVDFEIGQGGQYVNLLHALSGRQIGKPAVVRISTVASGGEESKLAEVRDRLAGIADRVGVRLQFNVLTTHRPEDLTREALGCDGADEPLAVNFAFNLYRTPDESVSVDNPRDALLRRVKSLSPRIVVLVEQEMNTNTAPFVARVSETTSYYGALLDSIDSVARDHPDRVKVESGLGRRILNSVACEGRNRVERCEVFGKWRARFGMAGFEPKPLNPQVAELMRTRLNSGNRVNPGFTVVEQNGAVCFGWRGRTLTVASAWR